LTFCHISGKVVGKSIRNMRGIMSAVRFSVMALAFLAACDGNPFVGVDPDPDPTDEGLVPDVVQQDMNEADYDPGAATIEINMSSQDASDLNATYARNAAFDVPGYQAYTYQESTSNRYVVAMVREVGSVKGLIAVEGGQFANYHGGGDFVRADVFSLPNSGVAGSFNYSGSYVGLMNIGTPVPGPGGDLDPTRSYRTTGRALITADFTEMTVSGGVDQRIIVDPMVDEDGVVDPTLDPTLETISLFETGITADGTFEGEVYIGDTSVGDYGGLFGGLNASEVATLLVFNPYPSGEVVEHGLIVLGNCDDVGGPACP
jgi:hypothetical protein